MGQLETVFKIANPDHIASFQLAGGRYPLIIDVASIKTAQIIEPKLIILLPADHGVAPGDPDVWEGNRTVGFPAKNSRLGEDHFRSIRQTN